jgi:hypothetical protein
MYDKEKLIQQLLDKKADEDNSIDLNAYALGLEAMFNAISNPIILLLAEGKGDSKPDYITPMLFATQVEADAYLLKVTTKGKYWVTGEIVDDNEKIELNDLNPFQ